MALTIRELWQLASLGRDDAAENLRLASVCVHGDISEAIVHARDALSGLSRVEILEQEARHRAAIEAKETST